MSNDPPTRGKVIVRTTLGPIDIELFSKESPKTCRAFIQLCQEGFYNQKRCFGRAIKSVLVETGAIQGSTITHQDGLPFASENHGRLRFTVRGRVACVASTGASSDFFISLDKCEWLNGKHTIFGKVTGDSLFNVVRIGELDTDKEDKPYEPPEILSIEVVENPFDDIICREFSKKKDVTSSSSNHSIQGKKIGTGGGRGGLVKRPPSHLLSFGGVNKHGKDFGNDDEEDTNGTVKCSKAIKRSLSEATTTEILLKKRSKFEVDNNEEERNVEEEEEDDDDDDRKLKKNSINDEDVKRRDTLLLRVSTEDTASAAAARRKEEFARLKKELKARKEEKSIILNPTQSKGKDLTISSQLSTITSSSASSSSSSSSFDDNKQNISTQKVSLLQQMRDKYIKLKNTTTNRDNRDAVNLEKLSTYTSKLKKAQSITSSSSLGAIPMGGLKFVKHIDDESRGMYVSVGQQSLYSSQNKDKSSSQSSQTKNHKEDYEFEDLRGIGQGQNLLYKQKSSEVDQTIKQDGSAKELADAIMREIQNEMS